MLLSFKKYLLTSLLVSSLSSCQSNSTLEDGNLNLEDISFGSFNTKKYYEKSMKAEWSEFHKKYKEGVSPIYFFQSEADTVDASGSNYQMGKAYAIMYHKSGSGGMNSWAKDFNLSFFKNLKFVELGAITDVDNKLLMIASPSEKLKKTEVANFILTLDKQYGSAKLNVLPKSFYDTEIRKWILKDRVITLISSGNYRLINDDSLKDVQKKYMSEKVQSDRTDATLYITKKDYDEIFSKMSTKMSFLVGYQ